MSAGWPAGLPPPPPGVPVIAPRPLDPAVDLDDWFRLLGDGIITVASPHTSGVIVVGARRVCGAVALRPGRHPDRVVHGDDGIVALTRAAQAVIAAGSLAPDEVEPAAALCTMTLRSHPIVLGCVRVAGFIEAAAELGATLALEVVVGSRGAVLLVVDGRPRLAYTRAHRLGVADFLAGAAAAAAAGSLVVHAHPGCVDRAGAVAGVLVAAPVSPPVPAVAGGGTHGPAGDDAASTDDDGLEALIVEHLGPYGARAPALARAALATAAAGSSAFDALHAAVLEAAPHPLLRSREAALAALISCPRPRP